jgi:hypothetical protein
MLRIPKYTSAAQFLFCRNPLPEMGHYYLMRSVNQLKGMGMAREKKKHTHNSLNSLPVPTELKRRGKIDGG